MKQKKISDYELKRQAQKQAEIEAIYAPLKDRKCVQKIIEYGGKTQWAFDAIKLISKIDAIIKEGKTYADVFQADFGYASESDFSLAFILHIEETHDLSEIKTWQELSRLAKLDDFTDVEECFILACENKYELTLDNLVRAFTKADTLLGIKPSDFNLPDYWQGREDAPECKSSKKKIIEKYNKTAERPRINQNRAILRAWASYHNLRDDGTKSDNRFLSHVLGCAESVVVEASKYCENYGNLPRSKNEVLDF